MKQFDYEVSSIIINDHVDSCEVISQFLSENVLNSGSNKHAYRLIKEADKYCKRWEMRYLLIDDIMEIMLPWHIHSKELYSIFQKYYTDQSELESELCKVNDDYFIVNKDGSTVSEAIERYSRIEALYRKRCPDCSATIDYHISNSHIGTLFFSTRPLVNDICYKYLKPKRDQLIHLDGFHRMISFGYSNIKREIPCLVAVM